MYRIGIIGSENSHAMIFSKIFNSIEGDYRHLNCRVVAVMGEDEAASRAVADACGVSVVSSPKEMLGAVDAVMVTSRNGGLHLRYARPFLEAGIPAFVDKPIANDFAEAAEIARLARASGAPLMGGSSTKLVPAVLRMAALREAATADGTLLGGSVWAPLNMVNPYGGFYFYSSHLVEIALRIFGQRPASVIANEARGSVAALLRYPEFDVSLHFLQGAGHYGATVHTAKASPTGPIDISECYLLEARAFAEMLATGAAHQPIEDLIRPVLILNAIEEAYRTGAPRHLPDVAL